jgi:hypothetical protein
VAGDAREKERRGREGALPGGVARSERGRGKRARVSERAERGGGGPSELAGPRAKKEKGRVRRAREINPQGGLVAGWTASLIPFPFLF